MELCPKPIRTCEYYKLNQTQLSYQMQKYIQKLQKLQEYVEKNKKFPKFKGNLGKIKRNALIYKQYQLLELMDGSCYYQNNCRIIRLEKALMSGKIPNPKNLFVFLNCALKYQKKNLAWFTKADWFNQNSAQIFEHLKSMPKKSEEQVEEPSEKFDFISEWLKLNTLNSMEEKNLNTKEKAASMEMIVQKETKIDENHEEIEEKKEMEDSEDSESLDPDDDQNMEMTTNYEEKNLEEKEKSDSEKRFNFWIRPHHSLRLLNFKILNYPFLEPF